jgi:hypothetical protein
MRKQLLIGGLAALGICACSTAQEREAYESDPINYSETQPHDGVAALQSRIAAGKVDLGHSDRDVVRALLGEFRIPVESQLLVLSKTSLQRQRIRPDHFTDNCYIGWVPSGLIEIMAIDPVLGPVFYACNPAAARTNPARCLERDTDCLRCHGGTFVRGIPGIFVFRRPWLGKETECRGHGDPAERCASVARRQGCTTLNTDAIGASTPSCLFGEVCNLVIPRTADEINLIRFSVAIDGKVRTLPTLVRQGVLIC